MPSRSRRLNISISNFSSVSSRRQNRFDIVVLVQWLFLDSDPSFYWTVTQKNFQTQRAYRFESNCRVCRVEFWSSNHLPVLHAMTAIDRPSVGCKRIDRVQVDSDGRI